MPGRPELGARQHRLLDLASDLEVVLERQPVGHFEQHEQIHEQEPREQPQRSRRERRMGNQQQVDFTKQLHQPDQAGDERDAVHHSSRGRQLERERQEEQPRASQHPKMPGSFLQLVEVDVAREEVVGLERVAREEALEVDLRQTT